MPFYNISRDKYPHEMYMMKNHLDKMIICYHNDERNSITNCQLLFQKGFDNIYMLTGGLEDFVNKYTDFCEGPGLAKIRISLKEKEIKEKDGKKVSKKVEDNKFIDTSKSVKSGITNSNLTVKTQSNVTKGNNAKLLNVKETVKDPFSVDALMKGLAKK